MESEETAIQSGLVDVKHELDKYVAKIRENNGRIKHFQNEVKLYRIIGCSNVAICGN